MTKKPGKLVKEQEIKKAKNAFYSVFISGECIDDPFGKLIENKGIIYYHQYRLDKKWYEAVCSAARELGETKAYISEVGLFMAKKSYELLTAINKKMNAPWDVSRVEKFKPRPFEEIVHWSLDLSSYPFDIINPFEEIAFYSAKGTWGIIFGDLGYAIIGGPPQFFQAIKKKIPDFENEVYEFLEDMKKHLDKYPESTDTLKSWLPSLLSQIYGPDASKKMLQHVELNELF